jgi:phage shock protein A
MNKKLVYGVLGETAGRTALATWRWAWGLPVESGGKMAQKVAQESLQDMQEKVRQLAEGVAKVVAAHEQAKQKYTHKQDEIAEAQKKAKLAHQIGNQEAARVAMTKVIMTEKIMPQLKAMVEKSEKVLNESKENLNREQEKLEAHKLEMANLTTLAEVNEAMKKISEATNSLDIGSAINQFGEAKTAIEGRYIQEVSLLELSQNPAEKIERRLDQLSLNDEISRRLEQLNSVRS